MSHFGPRVYWGDGRGSCGPACLEGPANGTRSSYPVIAKRAQGHEGEILRLHSTTPLGPGGQEVASEFNGE